MTAVTVEKLMEEKAIPKPERKQRKAPDKPVSGSNTRFFIGELDNEGKIVLSTEFASELDARLASFRLEQVYYEVGSWKAVANLGEGSIAVEKQAVTGKP